MNKESNRIQIGNRVVIYPRGKKQVYTAEFSQHGRHCRRSLKTTNLKVARQRAAKLETTLDEGGSVDKARSTAMSDAIQEYIVHLETESKRPRTITKLRSFLGVFREFARHHNVLRLDGINAALVDKFRANRKLTHSQKSMHNEGVMLKGFLNFCVSRSMLASNPMAAMTFKRPPLVPRGGPSLNQIDRLLGATTGQCHIQLAVLAFAGIRLGELQRLRPEDVDLEGNWLHIVSRPGYETKTGLSRKVPIHPRLGRLLQSLPKRKGRWLFSAPPSKWYPTGDNWINAKRLNEHFVTLVKKLGMPGGRYGGFTVHSLRHSFKAIALNAGIPERAIDCWLGHGLGQSVRAAYYLLADEESQRFMKLVPFGEGEPAADAGG